MSTADKVPVEPLAADFYRQWDAAYVLGALSPAERREFEEHLATCSDCQAAVAELAGMPGLLAQVSPDDAPALAGSSVERARDPAMPDTLVGRVVSLDRQRRRLVGTIVALAAALVLVAGLVGIAAVRGILPVSQSAENAPYRLAFTPVVPSGIIANVDVVPVSGGTDLRVECQYAEEDLTQASPGRDYDIVVKDRSGHETSVKTWTARPNHLMTPSGMSSLPVSKIASVEIHLSNDPQPLLRADLP